MRQSRSRSQRPRVGLNAHLLSLQEGYRSAGVSRYIQHLLQELPQAGAPLDYVALVSERSVVPAGWRAAVSRWPTASPPVRIVWEQMAQPWACRAQGLALLHAPAHVGPLAPLPCPLVVTVHDLSFERYPAYFPRAQRHYLQHMTRWSLRRAEAVIAVSAATRDELTAVLGLPSERVAVVANGVSAEMRPRTPQEVANWRARRSLPEPMVLFVGTLEPRKNVATLIQAFALARERHGVPHRLVVAGGRGWYYEETVALVTRLRLGEAVTFAGYVPQAELPLWYAAADLFVYPSLYEGFGLPPLEAMACGTPVLISRAAALTEVAGPAAAQAEATDAEGMAEEMAAILGDASRRQAMREAGLARARAYTWQRTARETAAVYCRVLGRPEREAA